MAGSDKLSDGLARLLMRNLRNILTELLRYNSIPLNLDKINNGLKSADVHAQKFNEQ